MHNDKRNKPGDAETAAQHTETSLQQSESPHIGVAEDQAAKIMRSGRGSHEVAPTTDIAVGPDIRNYLGQKLKDSYDELVRQPVPDRFRQLLEQLERTEKK